MQEGGRGKKREKEIREKGQRIPFQNTLSSSNGEEAGVSLRKKAVRGLGVGEGVSLLLTIDSEGGGSIICCSPPQTKLQEGYLPVKKLAGKRL